jgi:hypothetical protein
MTSFYFDTREYTPDSKYGAMPDGTYNAMVVKAEERVSKTTNTPYLSLELEILEGKYKGRKVFENLFINGSETAQNIAKNKLNGIANALGLVVINSEKDFTFKPMSVVLATKEDKNEIKKYLPKQQNVEPAHSKAAPQIHDSIPF